MIRILLAALAVSNLIDGHPGVVSACTAAIVVLSILAWITRPDPDAYRRRERTGEHSAW